MSALDRLQGFSAKKSSTVRDAGVFDTKTPSGAFLQRVHDAGYKMYEPVYVLKEAYRSDESELSGAELEAYLASLEVSQEAYDLFNDEVKELYDMSYRHTELHDVLTTDGNQIVNAVAGSGKALVNGTKVLTAEGYRAIETLVVGDKVVGEDGQLHAVTGVFPQGRKEIYWVEFSDGNKIACSGDHLWEIENHYHNDEPKPQVMTTEAIYRSIPLRGDFGGYTCRVPVVAPIDFGRKKTKFTISPYLMGYLLFAVSAGNKEIWVNAPNDWDIADRVKSLLEDFGGYVIEIPIDEDDGSCTNQFYIEESTKLYELWCEMGLEFYDNAFERLGDMFIPEEYLYASREDRLELVRGMLDAIGALSMKATFFEVDTKRMRDDLCLLFEGLGMIASVIDRDDKYIVFLETASNVDLRYGDADDAFSGIKETAKRFITHVERLDRVDECTCIAIDSPRHLYLTEHCIVTHNTTMLVFKILHDIVTGRCMTLKELENGMTVRVANKVWVCTFLRSGAAELESALTRWQYKFGYSQTAPTLSFSTMDAEFKRCLNAMGVATPLDEGGKLYQCMVKAIDSCNIKRNGYNLSKEDYNIIGGIITYYRGRLDDQRYNHPSCKEYELTPTILDLLVKQFANLRQQAGIMDFSEIMELLYKYLYTTPNPQVQEFVANRYNFIYIDEFQDTSQMAYAILKFYARGKLWINRGASPSEVAAEVMQSGLYTGHETLGKLVVVGDTAQCVMPETMVRVQGKGLVRADEVVVGDMIQAIVGRDRLGVVPVSEVIVREYDGNVCKISLSNGSVLPVTEDHKCFVKISPTKEVPDIELCMFGGDSMASKLSVRYPDGTRFCHQSYNIEDLEELMKDTFMRFDDMGAIPSVQRNAVLFMGEKYKVVGARDVKFGDVMCCYNETTGSLEQVGVLGVVSQVYKGSVYDFNIYDVHNFVANSAVVHNCIYSFRGSDSNILATEVAEDFKPTISTLSVNWRCPNVILDPVVPSIHKNWDSASQDIRAANKGGELFAYTFKNYQQMIAQLKTDIQKDMDDGMRVAILCRTNFDGLIPAVVLEQDGRFNFSVSGENMTMTSPLPRKLIGMTSLFTECATVTVKNSLMEFAGKVNGWAVKQLVDTLKQNGKSFWDVPEEDIRYSCPVLLDLYRDIKPLIFKNGKRDKQSEVDALRVVYFKLMQDVYAGDSAYCESARAYLETLLFILEQGNFQSVYEFLEEIEFLNDKLNGRIKKKKVYIQIATVHEFKGKEADSVYVWNDNDGVFPYAKTNLGVESELNEERRVHYIACTRAKKREHIYAIAGKVGMFAREMSVKFTNPVPVAAKLPKKQEPLGGS